MDGSPVDRLVSGAGAVAAGADDWVRGFGESEPRWSGRRPLGVAAAIALLFAAGLLALVGLEATDPPTIGPIAADALTNNDTTSGPARATITGALVSTSLWTYQDSNANGSQDASETDRDWYYVLVTPSDLRGVLVHSVRPPSAIFTATYTGVMAGDDPRLDTDLKALQSDLDHQGLHLAQGQYLDARQATTGSNQEIRPGASLPAAGSSVTLDGSRLTGFVPLCSRDPDHDGVCELSEADTFEVVVYDQASGSAVAVVTRNSPVLVPVTISGRLRRDERAIDDAQANGLTDMDDLTIGVSPRFVLDDASIQGASPIAYILAIVLALLAGTILVGSAGGYLVFRGLRVVPGAPASEDPAAASGPAPEVPGAPDPADPLGPGERRPLRVTGYLHTPTGRVHLRERPVELVRFVLRPDPLETTLLLERPGHPQGVHLGAGHLTRLRSGMAIGFRAQRPAIAVTSDTGRLIMTFDTDADRDQAATELRREARLGDAGRP